MSEEIEPFTLHVPEDDLADLRRRLAAVRWPAGRTVADTSQGPTEEKLRTLVEHWRDTYDWRACEAELNRLGQYRTTIDGLDINFLHVRSAEPDALPLIMTHGWPGSVLGFRKVIGPLTDPAAYGGNPRDAFHLVLPTLPGFGFAAKPAETGWDPGRDRRRDARGTGHAGEREILLGQPLRVRQGTVDAVADHRLFPGRFPGRAGRVGLRDAADCPTPAPRRPACTGR